MTFSHRVIRKTADWMSQATGRTAAMAITCGSLVVAGTGVTSAHADVATYRVDFDVTWSTTSHPGAFPGAAHFDSFVGFTHEPASVEWSEGALASPGLKDEAETGSSAGLVSEWQAAVDAGQAHAVIDVPGWICPGETVNAACIDPHFEFEATEEFHLVTLAAMIGPSPDWFVGVSALSLRENDQWIESIELPIWPYDAGTRASDDTFNLGGPLSTPPEEVVQITDNSRLIGPDSLGTMTFTLIPEPTSALTLAGIAGLLTLRRRS